MNRGLVIVAAVVVVVALYAVTATAGGQAVTPKQFKALSKKVTTLQREVAALENCLQAIPVAQFGDDRNHTEGYVYDTTSPSAEFLTTALDVTDAAHASAWAVVTNSTCASALNGGRKATSFHFRAHTER